MKSFVSYIWKIILLASLASLFGCGGGGASKEKVYTLNQAAFNGSAYVYGFDSVRNIKILDAPKDADFNRWAMLHDGGIYRLYIFKQGSSSTLYQFAYNSAKAAYEYGFGGAIPELAVTGVPSDADTSSFAMLHDGNVYRLYMKSKTKSSLHQFAYNAQTQSYEYGFSSIDEISITGSPSDADLSRWGMLHDGTRYRFYAFKGTSKTDFYQYAFNGSSYAYGFSSIANLKVTGMPAASDTSNFAMLHDGVRYRFYFKEVQEK